MKLRLRRQNLKKNPGSLFTNEPEDGDNCIVGLKMVIDRENGNYLVKFAWPSRFINSESRNKCS